jgi:hypothetical protein
MKLYLIPLDAVLGLGRILRMEFISKYRNLGESY